MTLAAPAAMIGPAAAPGHGATGTGRLAAAVASGIGAQSGPPTSVRPGSAAGPDSGRPPAARLAWRRCAGEPTFDCSTLVVPLDYADPAGPTISLAVRRLRAADPRRRIGSLVVNPGGPGGSGIEFLRRARNAFGTRLRDRFDLVSWDPRGVGSSQPVRCSTGPAGLERYLAVDPDPDTDAEELLVAREVAAFAAGCATVSGSALLRNVDTESSARDLERLREALGERLSYLGFSYGTLLGAVYADLFPTRIRAMVLDGALDPAVSTFDRLTVQAGGFEESFQLWVGWCRQDRSCRSGVGDDPATAVADLLAGLDAEPLRVGKRTLSQAEGLYAVLASMYSPRSSREPLADAIGDARRGRGAALLRLADGYNDRERDGSYRNTVEANVAINCADEATPTDRAAYERLADDLERVSPVFGRAIAWSALPCGRWPVRSRSIVGPRRAVGSPPIVVVGTLRDPATPAVWARALAAQLANGVLVENDATGHAAYFGGGTCVRAAVEDHLLGIGTPRNGLRCGSSPVTTSRSP